MQNEWKFKGKHDYTKILARGCKEVVLRYHVLSHNRDNLQCVSGGLKVRFWLLWLQEIASKNTILILLIEANSNQEFDLSFPSFFSLWFGRFSNS